MDKILLFMAIFVITALPIVQGWGAEYMDDATLNRLVFSFDKNVQMLPGDTCRFSLNTIDGWRLQPVYVRTRWSVEPTEGAVIEPDGTLIIASSTLPGSIFTVIADIEGGRRVMTMPVYVYTPAFNPFVGIWKEDRQILCNSSAVYKPAQPVRELVFRADGTFSLTWIPFETHVDYWGKYSYDPEKRLVNFVIEGGNDIPVVMDKSGSFSINDKGELVFEKMWFGSPDQHRFNKTMLDKLRPDICSDIFVRLR